MFALIPCGFTFINMFIAGIQGILILFFVDGNIMIPLDLLMMVASFVIWLWVGNRSYDLENHYGKALLFFNAIGFINLIFALIYYSLTTVTPPVNGIALLPVGFTDSLMSDIFAGSYSSGFLFGYFLASLLPDTANYPLFAIIFNTSLGLLSFSAGYLSRSLDQRREQRFWARIEKEVEQEEEKSIPRKEKEEEPASVEN